jgi:hypothetical protein
MALEKKYTTDHGFECPNCYMVVIEAVYVKNNNAQGKLLAFKDKEAKEEELMPIFSWNFAFQYHQGTELSIIQQAYEAIKKNIDYLDAIDA